MCHQRIHSNIIQIFISVVTSCDIKICLTWDVKSHNITFKCRVNYLKFAVTFKNPLNQEMGYCQLPIPVSSCHTLPNNSMTQDLETNTTTLIVRKHIGDSINGPWTCCHGTNIDVAVVNVTVLKGIISDLKCLYLTNSNNHA